MKDLERWKNNMKTLKELSDFANRQVLTDFDNKYELEKMFSDFLEFEIKFEELEYDSRDYAMGVNLSLGDKDLYFDIWHLMNRYGGLVITEIGFDSDNTLNDSDYDKIIKPLKESE
jgi:hypothetical protein